MTWPMVKLESVAVINPRLPKNVDEEQKVSFVAMASASEDGRLLSEENRVLSETKKGFTYFNKGDVLLAKITPCFENGKCLRPNQISNPIGFGSTEFHVLRANVDELDSLYLFYMLWNAKFRSLGEASMSGAAGQKRVSTDFLKSFEIPLPPLAEQQRIAAILDKADAIRRKRQQAIQLADDFLRAVFLDMFGDPVTNPKGWEVQRIGSLGTAITGATPPGAEKGMWGDEVPFVTPGDLGDVVVSANRYLSQKGVEYSRVCRAGSLMVCCIGATIGKVGISSTPSAFNQQINSLEWSSKVNDFYGYYLFKLFPQLIVKNSIQTTLPILKKSLFENILIPVPRIELQERFESIFNQINKLINRNPSLLNRSLFNALSQKAFRGEL